METIQRPPESPAFGALRVAIVGVLFGGTALIGVYDWLGSGSSLDFAVNGPLFDAVVISAFLACALRALRGGRERVAWAAIAAAVLAAAAAEIYWSVFLAHNPPPPSPSPADAGYLAFYPLAVAGVALLIRERARELDWRLWVDGAIAALGTAALGTAIVFEYVADRATGTGLQMATTLAYPLADIFVLSLVVGVVALTRWRPGATWTLLLAGLGALSIADIAYSVQLSGGLPGGDWTEPIYLVGAVCLASAALRPEAARIAPVAHFDGWRELTVPGFFAVVMIGLFSIQYASSASLLTAILTAATMLAVVARLAFSLRENKKLLEQIRTDPLTGLGNQAGMQVDLANLCLRAGEEPATLLVLDLNGFKGFNDRFGHLAGDAMLSRLGEKLGARLTGYGSAYRIGGDEFAVLVSCELDEIDAVAKRAAEALTDSGEDYELGAAWGSVAIPTEASTPATALQVADMRMYAQKQSRRIAHQGSLKAPRGATTIRLRGPRDGEAVKQRH